MQINSVTGSQSFGLNVPENFAQTLVKQCAGFSMKNAVALEKALREIPSDAITIKNLYTKSRKQSLFGPRYNTIGVDYEYKAPCGDIQKKECGYLVSSKKPFSVENIIDIVKEQIKKLLE